MRLYFFFVFTSSTKAFLFGQILINAYICKTRHKFAATLEQIEALKILRYCL